MELKDFVKLIKRKKQTIVSILVLFLFLTSVAMIFQPFKYEAKSQVLILQHHGATMDPYVASKSNEYISTLLSRVVYSSSFLNDVYETGFNIDKSYFGDNPTKKIKTWEKTASVKTVRDSGILMINVYHKDRSQAEQINRAISNVFQQKHGTYHGRENDVTIRIIDEPIVSKWPVKPNVILNFSLAIIIGLLVSLSYIYLFPEEEFNLNLLPKRKKRVDNIVKNVNLSENKDELKNNNSFPQKSLENSNNSIKYSVNGDISNVF